MNAKLRTRHNTHTRIHVETLEKLRILAQRYNANQVDVLDWLIDLAYEGEVYPQGENLMNTRTIEKWDRVLIDGETPGEVVQDGGTKSLVSTRRSDGEAGEQRDWYDNTRLTVRQRRKEKAQGDEPPEVELY